MRIAICTSGRFHVCDLARELAARGHEVRFYSYVPKKRSAAFGLPLDCARSVLLWVAPALALERLLGRTALGRLAKGLLVWWLDLVVSLRLEPCDVLIAMSGMYYRTARSARRRWGAKILIERGSRHIESQREILQEVARLAQGVQVPTEDDVRRELRDYALADYVVVPSRHAEQSFVERGFPPERIFRNPYGVDLSTFARAVVREAEYDLIFVGSWCYRKGADLLEDALKGTELRLLHVGGQGDRPFPKGSRFEAVGVVDQAALEGQYARARVQVLPSREDGFGMVLCQAVACGLRVVASDRTGGPDLLELMGEHVAVDVVPVGDVEALRAAIVRACSEPTRPPEVPLDPLSWASYGARYDSWLRCLS